MEYWNGGLSPIIQYSITPGGRGPMPLFKKGCRMNKEIDQKVKELICPAMESLGIGVTIIDAKGTLLYYYKQAARILDRKPEYIGEDVYSHHTKATSSQKLESMIEAFQKGRTEPFHYEARPYGKTILVTLSPILENDSFIGCSQCVQIKEDMESKYLNLSQKHI
jgi:DUF438 domain-containing protein